MWEMRARFKMRSISMIGVAWQGLPATPKGVLMSSVESMSKMTMKLLGVGRFFSNFSVSVATTERFSFEKIYIVCYYLKINSRQRRVIFLVLSRHETRVVCCV